jgi:hypothetical protein
MFDWQGFEKAHLLPAKIEKFTVNPENGKNLYRQALVFQLLIHFFSRAVMIQLRRRPRQAG